MSHVIPYFLLVALLLGWFAWTTARARRDTWMRHVVVVMFVASLPLLALASVEVSGWSRPVSLAHVLRGGYAVVGSKIVVGEAVYLYLDSGEGEPLSVMLPWDPKEASELQDLLDTHGYGRVFMEYEWSLDPGEPKFYPLPPPVLDMPKGESTEPLRLEQET